MHADVVLPSRRFQVFTYHIPQSLQAQVAIGSPVLIPLGSSVLSGVVVRILEPSALPYVRSSNPTMAFRDILSVDTTSEHSTLDQRLIMLVEHIAEYYLAPLAACLPLIVPPRLFKVVKRLVLTEVGRQSLTDAFVSSEEQLVLRKIARGTNGVLRSSLLRALPKAGTLVTKLKKKGWIEERSTLPARFVTKTQGSSFPRSPVRASSYGEMGDLFEQGGINPQRISSSQRALSEKMNVIADGLVKKGLSGTFQKEVVFGTDHERFQVVQHVASSMFQRGKRILLLFPEVHQVDAVASQLRDMWHESVEVYHGQLSTPVRAECWERIRQGRVQLVVGTRSALFLPLTDLGLIWVDQEEDASYKDEHLPYYHAREVARIRGAIEHTLVVYGSACPSLETYAEFCDTMQQNIQVSISENPDVNVIDMREQDVGALLARPLIDRLTQVVNEGHQAILILNRKGFSPALICRDCGKAPTCKICGIPFRLFQRPSRLLCSFCEKSDPMPETCPSCLGTVFRYSGAGTQRLEEELTRIFPAHVVFRYDRDQIKTAEEALNALAKFRQGDIHLLIGTEFLLHQPHPPSAKLIAFPQADLGLHLPDFRSAERTFLLFSKAIRLVQARAQVDGASGEIFLQTRMPDHHVFQAMVQRDSRVFYQQESELREVLAYPPSAHLLLLVVTGVQAVRVQRVVEFLEQHLKKAGLQGTLLQEGGRTLGLPMVLGPLNSRKPGSRKKNRTIFLLKTFDLPETQQRLRIIQQAYAQEFGKEPVVFEVHVDPLEVQ